MALSKGSVLTDEPFVYSDRRAKIHRELHDQKTEEAAMLQNLLDFCVGQPTLVITDQCYLPGL